MADERDPKLSQHYRDLEALEPSPELDRTILAAAVAPSGRHRWYYSLAAAAVLVFAVALTIHIERQQPDPEAAPPPSVPAPSLTLHLEKELPKEAKAAAEAAPAPRPQVLDEMRSRAEAPATARSPQAANEMRARRDAGVAQQSAPAARAAERALARAVAEPPERWLERIAELRSRGKHEEADKALAEFRRAYPDYRMSEVMRERVEGK